MVRCAGLGLLLTIVLAPGCGDDSSGNPDLSACTGGPAAGAADTHCGGTFTAIVAAECSADAGAPNTGGGDYGDTMYGTTAYDDDCKYAVSYTVDPICENGGTSFTITLKNAKTNALVPNASEVRAEVFLDDTHPAPNSGATTSETSPGIYKVGPIKFDKPGTWTVRFHFFEGCTDAPASPHGHAAFFVTVP